MSNDFPKYWNDETDNTTEVETFDNTSQLIPLEETKPLPTIAEQTKIVAESDISEEQFASYLDTAGIPDPDLLIRTSGEQRLSNFMLWQLGYTEFYFTDILWPDFNKKELKKAIDYYNHRDRRFGGV